MTSATTRAEMDWSAIKMVDDHAGMILLFVDRMSAMMIPRRAFPDAASVDRFVAIVRAVAGVAGSHSPLRLHPFFSVRKVH